MPLTAFEGLDVKVKAHYNVRAPARDLQRGLGLGLLLRDPPKSLWLLVKASIGSRFQV